MRVTVKNETELVVPRSVRRLAGIKSGDRVEFQVSAGVINIIPKRAPADDEYTPAQRRIIDARLAAASKGPYYGPFDTIEELDRSLRQTAGKSKRRTKPAARR